MIESFHFLRPLWLLGLPAVLLLWWLLRHGEAQRSVDSAFLAPHLRAALTISDAGDGRLRTANGLAVAMLLLSLAAAGPSWREQLSPWFKETTPLIVAIEVSDSMRSNDVLPSRLDRARYEVVDLVTARTGAPTALIAYAGSAHLVLPPTTDVAVLEAFLASLDPSIMPAAGSRAATVLPVVRELLAGGGAPATLLFVNDGFADGDAPALARLATEEGAPELLALIVGRDEGGVVLMPDGSPALASDGRPLDTRIDRASLRRIEREAGVDVVRVGAGDSDTRALLRRIVSRQRAADDPEARWRDEAWFVLWPVLLLVLLWFRRGRGLSGQGGL